VNSNRFFQERHRLYIAAVADDAAVAVAVAAADSSAMAADASRHLIQEERHRLRFQRPFDESPQGLRRSLPSIGIFVLEIRQVMAELQGEL
jgi:hypothetical protein